LSQVTFENEYLVGEMMELLAELWALVLERGKFWLIPIFIVIGVLGGLLVLSQGSVIAPFVYTIF
jgi:hypothetical protein